MAVWYTLSMNRDRRPIIINLSCGILAAVFLVFAMFAFSTHAAALAIITAALFVAVCTVWVWALMSLKKENEAAAVSGDEAESVAAKFSRLRPKSFKSQIRTCQKQLARLQEKTEAMDRTLHEAFGDSTISIDKFMTGIHKARMLFLANQRQIADRILIFDDEGYRNAQREGNIPAAYRETFDFIDGKIADNENILTKIDELNAQVQTLKATPRLEDGSAMRQLDDLIRQSDLYRQKEKEKEIR